AGLRRLPLQKKIGAALTEEEFRIKASEGKIGHAGLRESVALVADTVGWNLDDIRQNIQPVIAHEFVKSEYFEIPPGRVTGLRQTASGFAGNTELVNLHLEMYVGARNSVDSIYIDGTPDVQMQVPGGLHGDLATASIVVNMIPRVLSASPGLKTMATLPPPASYVNDIRKHL
ncbi:MAG: dihydrodipicolinate reductase, partial [Candidatus Bathyarchaeia archaeon]